MLHFPPVWLLLTTSDSVYESIYLGFDVAFPSCMIVAYDLGCCLWVDIAEVPCRTVAEHSVLIVDMTYPCTLRFFCALHIRDGDVAFSTCMIDLITPYNGLLVGTVQNGYLVTVVQTARLASHGSTDRYRLSFSVNVCIYRLELRSYTHVRFNRSAVCSKLFDLPTDF